MKWRKFEHKIQSDLHQQSVEIDTDALWAAIEPEIDALNDKKKRRGLIWFFLIGAGLFMAAMSWWWMQMPEISTPEVADNAISVEIDQTKIEENKAVATIDETLILKEEKSAKKEKITEPNTSISESKKGNNQSNNNLISTTHSKNKLINSTTETNPVSTNKFDNYKINKGQFDDKNQLKNAASKPIAEVVSNNLVNENITRKSTTIETLFPIAQRRILAFNIVNEKELTPVADLPDLESFLPPPGRFSRKWQWSADVRGGIAYPNQQLSLKDSVSTDYLTDRRRTTDVLEAVSAAVLVNLHHKESGFSFSTGIQYIQINERLRFNESIVTTDSIFGIQAFQPNLNGGVDTIFGLIPNERITTFQKEHFNKIRMIEVPLFVGYQYQMDRFVIGLQTGVYINITTSASGQYLGPDDSFIDISESNLIRDNVGLSLHGSVYLGYEVMDDLEIYLNPQVRFFPQHFSTDQALLNTNYDLYGMQVGVRKYF